VVWTGADDRDCILGSTDKERKFVDKTNKNATPGGVALSL